MASNSRVHTHEWGYYVPQQPMGVHQVPTHNRHHYAQTQGDRYEGISLEEQGRHSRQAREVNGQANEKCCLARPSNAISATSFVLGGLSTVAHFVLPKISGLAENAAVIAAQKPLLYGGIGGMALGVVIQLAKRCGGTGCNGPIFCDPCGSAPNCNGCDCPSCDCGCTNCC